MCPESTKFRFTCDKCSIKREKLKKEPQIVIQRRGRKIALIVLRICGLLRGFTAVAELHGCGDGGCRQMRIELYMNHIFYKNKEELFLKNFIDVLFDCHEKLWDVGLHFLYVRLSYAIVPQVEIFQKKSTFCVLCSDVKG